MKSLLKITTDIFMSLSFIFLMFYNFTGEKRGLQNKSGPL